MKDFFLHCIYYVGISIVGIIVYFIGNFLFGALNEGGKRTILAILGTISGTFGFFALKFSLEDSEKFSHVFLLVALGIIFFGFGVYLFLAAWFASQNHIRKLFDGLLGGWNP